MSKPRRYQSILDAAITVAERDGLTSMSRTSIAIEADVAMSLVSYYLGTMRQLRRTVMRHAICHRRYKIIAEGLARKDPTAMKVSDDIKQSAIEEMMS